jgi:hypothetical protein
MNDYNKIGWVNGSEPAISAENLNHMDDGIEAATEAVTAVENDLKDNFYNAEEAEDYFLSQNDAKETYATKTELANKADKATTLAGYGITDTYTKNQTDELLGKKANTQDVDDALSAKQDALTFDSTPTIGSNNPVTSNGVASVLSSKADTKSVTGKADKATTLAGYGITDTYTKDEIENNYLTIIAAQNIYVELNNLLKNIDEKANKATTLDGYDITDGENSSNKVSTRQNIADTKKSYPSIAFLDNYYYTQDDTDDLLDEKADKATTLEGYGVTDAYTKDETNYQISDLAQYGYFTDPKAQDVFDKLCIDNTIIDGDYQSEDGTNNRPYIAIPIKDSWGKIAITVTGFEVTNSLTTAPNLRIRLTTVDGFAGNQGSNMVLSIANNDFANGNKYTVNISDYPTAKYLYFYPNANITGHFNIHLLISDLDVDIPDLSGVKIDCTTIPKIVNQLSDTTSIEALNGKSNIINNLSQVAMGYCTSWQNASSKEDTLTLLHFTDIHNSANAKRISDFFADYADYIDSAICTGDMLGSRFDDSYDFWGNFGCGRIMVTLGNHDVFTENTYDGNEPAWNGATTYIVPQKMCYDKFIAPYVSDWYVTQPDEIDVKGSKHYGACYYFKDYAEYKVRLFALDCMHWSTAQSDWFKTELDNAKSLGYGVVCGYHYPLGKTDSIGTTWCVPRPYERQTPTTAKAVGIVSDFIDNGGEFICWLSGHYHQDAVGVLTDDNRQLDINLDCASYAGITTETMPVVGTKSQDCFTIIGFDTTAKYIKMYRVGRDTNRYMQKHEVFCWDYANGKLIFNG